MNTTTKVKLLFYVLAGMSMASTLLAAGNPQSAISSALCSIVGSVRNIVGIVALGLFLVGGVMYAIAHFLPTSLEYRKSLTGWSTAMITGGIIGLVVVLIAQPLVQMFTGIGNELGGSTGTNIINC